VRADEPAASTNGSPSGQAIRTDGAVHVRRSSRSTPRSCKADQMTARQAAAVDEEKACRTAM